MQVTLTQLIERRAVTPCAFALMQQPAIEALAMMRDRQGSTQYGSIGTDSFLIDCEAHSVEVRPVGHTPHTGGQCADIEAYGRSLAAMLTSMPSKHLRIGHFAQMCIDGQLATWEAARLALERGESQAIFWWLVALLAALLCLLAWLNSMARTHPIQLSAF